MNSTTRKLAHRRGSAGRPLLWWPGMNGYVNLYIQHCHASQVMKVGSRKPAGLLQPLQVPDCPWVSVSMDLITALHTVLRGKDCILVVCDRITKMCTLKHAAP